MCVCAFIVKRPAGLMLQWGEGQGRGHLLERGGHHLGRGLLLLGADSNEEVLSHEQPHEASWRDKEMTGHGQVLRLAHLAPRTRRLFKVSLYIYKATPPCASPLRLCPPSSHPATQVPTGLKVTIYSDGSLGGASETIVGPTDWSCMNDSWEISHTCHCKCVRSGLGRGPTHSCVHSAELSASPPTTDRLTNLSHQSAQMTGS